MAERMAALLRTPTRRRKLQRWESDVSVAEKAPRPRTLSPPAPFEGKSGCHKAMSPEPNAKLHLASTVPAKRASHVDSEVVAKDMLEKPACGTNRADDVLITKMFDAMESALIILHGRRTRTSVSVVRQAVELDMGRDLDDTRLRRILTAAEGMVQASWQGKGPSAVLELIQRADDGDARPPTTAERAARRDRFMIALEFAVDSKSLPPRPEYEPSTPARPSASPCPFASPSPSLPSATPGASPVPSPCVGKLSLASRFAEADNSVDCTSFMKPRKLLDESRSGNDRLQSLRERVQKREVADRAAENHRMRIAELVKRIATCEEAMIAHGVVVQLFARGGSFTDECFASSQIDDLFKRGGGSAGKASEAEVINGLTAARSGMQSRRPIDAICAREALDCLTEFAAGWFVRSSLQYSNRPGSILRRLPGGSSTAATEALASELVRLSDERVSLDNAGITVGDSDRSAATEASKDPTLAPAARAPSPAQKKTPVSSLVASTPVRRRARAESPCPAEATPCRKPRRDQGKLVAEPSGNPVPSPAPAPNTLSAPAVPATPQRRLRRVVTYEDDSFLPSASPSASCAPSPSVEATPRRRLRRVLSSEDEALPPPVAATPQKRTRSSGPVSTDAATIAAFATPSKRVARQQSRMRTTPAAQIVASATTPSKSVTRQQIQKEAANAGLGQQELDKSRATVATPSQRREETICQASPPSATPRRRVRGKTPFAEFNLC